MKPTTYKGPVPFSSQKRHICYSFSSHRPTSQVIVLFVTDIIYTFVTYHL